MSTTGTKVPAIIDIPADIDPKIKRVLDSLKEASEVRLGRRGDPRDRAITLRELVDSGLAVELKDNPLTLMQEQEKLILLYHLLYNRIQAPLCHQRPQGCPQGLLLLRLLSIGMIRR